MYAEGTVPFIAARRYLPNLLEHAPMFRPIADALPSAADPVHRSRCERLLTRLFMRALYLPKLSVHEARRLLQHNTERERFIEHEFESMRGHPELRAVLEDWSVVWRSATDERECAFVRYATALLGRLYRLEYAVRLGGDIGRLTAC